LPLRLGQGLAAAGYPAAVLHPAEAPATPETDRGDRLVLHPAVTEAAALAGLAELRRRVTPDRVVVVAACEMAQVAARCAAAGHAEGLVLVGSRLPPEAQPRDLDVFGRLEPFEGSLLLLGASDLQSEGPDTEAVRRGWMTWRAGGSERHAEMAVIDGPRIVLPVDADHEIAPPAYAGVVIDFTLQWLERRFGPGYPRAWQGPPPGDTPTPPTRPDSPEARVPLLTTGVLVVPHPQPPPGGHPWQLMTPEGRAFTLTEALYRLVSLIDGHRSVGAISQALSEQLGHPVSPEQVARLVQERLAPLGVVDPDARGEGGEEDSGMIDILIRCYEPGDRLRALLDNLTRVTRSPYNVILVVGKRHAARNQNLALDRARTRYAVFLDDDILLTEGWLERLRETMDRTGAGAVSARERRMSGSLSTLAAAYGDGEIAEAIGGGACFMFRNDLGVRFDEAYVRSQWDDLDFIFQFYERNFKTYIDGGVDFYHHNDPKLRRGQNLTHFAETWIRKKLLRAWALYMYQDGSAFMPCYGPVE
jgi:hypothetical protein